MQNTGKIVCLEFAGAAGVLRNPDAHIITIQNGCSCSDSGRPADRREALLGESGKIDLELNRPGSYLGGDNIERVEEEYHKS